MKKILLAVFVFTGFSVFSQEEIDPKKQQETESKKKDVVIGLKYQSGKITTLGVEAEFNGETTKSNFYQSTVAYVSYSEVDYKINNLSHIGNGFELGLGKRYYRQKVKGNKGVFIENFTTYGKMDFDHTYTTYSFPVTTTNKFEGTYSYWSLVNINVGYKLKAGNFAFEPQIGAQWNWEIKGKGQIDNKYIDNFFRRAGLKIAYTF